MLGRTPPWAMVTPASSLFSSSSFLGGLEQALTSQPDGQLEVPGDDSGLLVVPGGVAGQLENLGGEVLHDGGHVDGGPGAHALRVVALPAHEGLKLEKEREAPEEPVDPAHGELEPRPAGPRLGLALHLAALATSGHLAEVDKVCNCGND